MHSFTKLGGKREGVVSRPRKMEHGHGQHYEAHDLDERPFVRTSQASGFCSEGIDGHSHNHVEAEGMSSFGIQAPTVMDYEPESDVGKAALGQNFDQTVKIHHLLHHLHNYSLVSKA